MERSSSSSRSKPKRGGLPKWVIVTPENVLIFDRIDMATNAQPRFFGPTNKDNTSGAERDKFVSHGLE